MVKVCIHGIILVRLILIEPALWQGVLAIILYTFITLLTLVLVNDRGEIGDGGIDLPDLAVLTDIVRVNGIPHTWGVGLHRVRTDNLEQGRLQFCTLLTISRLIVGCYFGRKLRTDN